MSAHTRRAECGSSDCKGCYAYCDSCYEEWPCLDVAYGDGHAVEVHGVKIAKCDTHGRTEASPSLPDLKSPEALRFAADVLSNLETDADHYHLCNDLIDLADRFEREQAAKTAQDHTIEQAAQVLFLSAHDLPWGDWQNHPGADHFRKHARALADAGLLNTKHGEA